ncbi:4Fe-4S dicluster domain-containing protein [Desulfobacterales bacterium HSG17]|nr:4Fe-4S dicluster domain-containing protein [Desulfobacterales bacterium HSG17]
MPQSISQKSLSRRAFLKGGVAAAVSVTAATAAGAVSKSDAEPVEELATLIDIQKCIGCEACVDACRETNPSKYPHPEKPFPKMFPPRVKVEDWSDEDKQEIRDRLTPYNWIFIQEATVMIDNEEAILTIPRRCMHCSNPPCVKLCPWGAAKQYKNGISRIDRDLCLGGSKCKSVCPWKIPQRQTGEGLYLDILPKFAGNGVMFKCDRCYQNIARGELPACIDACPEDVQTIGPKNEVIAKAKALAAQINGYTYGITENGGTNTIYVSPVPFEEIQGAIEKGNGKPGFQKVPNMMADANNLATAMLIAPLAGAAAAFGHVAKFIKKESSTNKGVIDHEKP